MDAAGDVPTCVGDVSIPTCVKDGSCAAGGAVSRGSELGSCKLNLGLSGAVDGRRFLSEMSGPVDGLKDSRWVSCLLG